MKGILKTIFIFICFLFSLTLLNPQMEVPDTESFIQNDHTNIVMVASSSTPELYSYSDRTNLTLHPEHNAFISGCFSQNLKNYRQTSYNTNNDNRLGLLKNNISIRAP